MPWLALRQGECQRVAPRQPGFRATRTMGGWISTSSPRCVPPRGRPRSPRRPSWPAVIRWPRRRRCARGVPPTLAAAALTQAELRRRAVGKFGPEAAGMFLTRPGLEQATRAGGRRPAGRPARRRRGAHPGRPGLRPRRRRARRRPRRHPGVRGGGRPGDRRDGRRERRGRRAGRAVHRRVRRRDGVRRDPGRRGLLRPGPPHGPAPAGGSSTRAPTRRRGTSSPGWPGGCRARW